MTVAELIERLKEMPQDAMVVMPYVGTVEYWCQVHEVQTAYYDDADGWLLDEDHELGVLAVSLISYD